MKILFTASECVPFVKTGGLADTVTDSTPLSLADRSATGFMFARGERSELIEAAHRALALYREPLAWRRLQLQGMAQDFSWNASAAKYVDLYHKVAGVPASEVSHEAVAERTLRSSAG